MYANRKSESEIKCKEGEQFYVNFIIFFCVHFLFVLFSKTSEKTFMVNEKTGIRRKRFNCECDGFQPFVIYNLQLFVFEAGAGSGTSERDRDGGTLMELKFPAIFESDVYRSRSFFSQALSRAQWDLTINLCWWCQGTAIMEFLRCAWSKSKCCEPCKKNRAKQSLISEP